jgi:hypothetical protein
MEFYFTNILTSNKYILISDGIDQFIVFGSGTSRRTIKQILKKYVLG